MKLQHLKHQACPECKARIVTIRQPSQHTNGEWFEEMKFECGCEVRYVPNFSREELTEPCPNSREVKIKQAKQRQAVVKLSRYIDRLDVDAEFKKHLRRLLGCWE